jgi:hypothetical protein
MAQPKKIVFAAATGIVAFTIVAVLAKGENRVVAIMHRHGARDEVWVGDVFHQGDKRYGESRVLWLTAETDAIAGEIFNPLRKDQYSAIAEHWSAPKSVDAMGNSYSEGNTWRIAASGGDPVYIDCICIDHKKYEYRVWVGQDNWFGAQIRAVKRFLHL